jgi:hypothetical protein
MGHAMDMYTNGFVSHVSPTTGTIGDRIRAARVPLVSVGENLALAATRGRCMPGSWTPTATGPTSSVQFRSGGRGGGRRAARVDGGAGVRWLRPTSLGDPDRRLPAVRAGACSPTRMGLDGRSRPEPPRGRCLARRNSSLLSLPFADQTGVRSKCSRRRCGFPPRLWPPPGFPRSSATRWPANALPGDVYDLAPASSRDLGEEVWEAHLRWGAAKAAALRDR